MGFSNVLTGVLNFITLVLSIPIIAFGVWLAHKHDTVCVRFLQWPIIVIGVFILLVSLAGMVGAFCGNKVLLWIYLFVMFLLILLLFVFTIFAFVVTNAGAGQAVSGKGFKEYKLGDYSNWLQKRVQNPSYWSKIHSCLSDGKWCDNLNNTVTTVDQFNNASLTPIESGCCKPPTVCGFTFVTATEWDKPANSSSTDTDCNAWNNTSTELCFECNSCRAGVLQNVKSNWRRVAVVNIIVLVFLIAVYSFGCCAFRNSRSQGQYSKYGHA